ncbi:FAD/NAD(P)-binding domain-containing protein [Venturia nashicola]|uniref:FAD/NAD(P)-binding domain-containing protein n=1 Tax=Venturia nashicola TaxID=86259 RepID=A0A4Z1NYZ1_9PEZI|nr:FAD/NAD(P)-binding domain-containing protein [Venturia nashicola]
MDDINQQSEQPAVEEDHIDVLVVGGGPVGLITAFQLARNLPSPHRIRIIEKETKSARDEYGRAITLFPRSVEMLDQLGLADALAQECFACRETVSYKDGKEIHGRGWYFMENMKDTTWDFALVLRQKYQEAIFREALKGQGVTLESATELVGLNVDERIPIGEHRITATMKNEVTGHESVVKCKYLVGADGGRSFVRRAAGIPFDGTSSEDKWVRVDGVVETDLPKPRTYCAIESPTHGNVLWAALDHGATRIGYAFTAERQKAYEVFDQEAAVKEAIASVKPFNLTFKQVDWWTIYIVGQRTARHFFYKDCIFLAGDACHTHSSGAAQGMNTGLHDAVNLSWKLTMVIRGQAEPSLLQSYETERRPNVEKLIAYDKDISRLMSLQLPIGWKGNPNADPNDILCEVMAEAGTFSSGLGIFYAPDQTLNIEGSFRHGSDMLSAAPGKRSPDVTLQKPATFETTRLHRETANVGRFYVVVFTGHAGHTSASLKILSDKLQSTFFFSNHAHPISFLTISASVGPSACEVLGIQPFGRTFYDKDGSAHERYGVDLKKGGIFVLRPDGWIGTAVEIGDGAVEELKSYFTKILRTGILLDG